MKINRATKKISIVLRGVTLSLALILLGIKSFSQEDTAFVHTYGGQFFEEGRQIIECAGGGFAIIGTTGSDQQNNSNFYLLRLDENLNCMWNKVLGGADAEWGYSLVEDGDGNLLLCGFTNSYGSGGYDVLVYKTDPDGEVLWQQTFGGSDWDFGYKIILHPLGGYLICGKTYSYGAGGSDGYLLHISTQGDIVQEWMYGNTGEDEIRDIISDESVIYLVQNSDMNSEPYAQINVLDFMGNLQNSYVTEDSIQVNSIKYDSSEIYLVGYQISPSSKVMFFRCIHKNNLGVFYTNIEDIGGNFMLNDLLVDDRIVLIGNTDAFGLGMNDQIWQQRDIYGAWQTACTFGSGFEDSGNSIIRASNQGMISVGSMGDEGSADLMLVYWRNSLLNAEYILETHSDDCFAVAIDNVEATQLSVANIAGNFLTFTGVTLPDRFTIYDSIGKKVVSEAKPSAITDLSFLRAGIYFLIYEMDNSFYLMKFLR